MANKALLLQVHCIMVCRVNYLTVFCVF